MNHHTRAEWTRPTSLATILLLTAAPILGVALVAWFIARGLS